MTKRKISKSTAAAKRKSRLKTHKAQAIMDVYEMAVMTPEQRAFEDELIRVSQYVKTHFTHFLPKMHKIKLIKRNDF